MDYGSLVYKVGNLVQSSLSSFLVFNSNIRVLSYYPTLKTLSHNTSILQVSKIIIKSKKIIYTNYYSILIKSFTLALWNIYNFN